LADKFLPAEINDLSFPAPVNPDQTLVLCSDLTINTNLEVELGITNIADFSYSVGSDEIVKAFSEYGQSCDDVGAP